MLEVGQSLQLGVRVTNSEGQELEGKTISWESSDPAVAAVSSSGEVSGIAEGEPKASAAFPMLCGWAA